MTATEPSVALDTNAYALFFQNPRNPALDKLEEEIKGPSGTEFFIPEIVSMEIHSVLGKFRRGGHRFSICRATGASYTKQVSFRVPILAYFQREGE